jgi:hypothetical protein
VGHSRHRTSGGTAVTESFHRVSLVRGCFIPAGKECTPNAANGARRCDLFLFLAIWKQRIPTDALLATQRLHPVCPALREPLVNALSLYLGQFSGLLESQHFAGEVANDAVSGICLPDNSLLLENGYFHSSFLYCGHVLVLKSDLFLWFLFRGR